MTPGPSTKDIFAKMDALLKRHQPGAAQAAPAIHQEQSPPPPIFEDIAPPAELAAAAERRPEPAEQIPTLTEVVAMAPEEPAIPVLTEIVETGSRREPDEHGEIALDEALHRLEDHLAQQLENRIAPQLSAAFDRALTELLETSRTYIEQAVRDTLAEELRKQLDAAHRANRVEKP